MRRIVGLGTVVVDHQVYLEHFPAPDTKAEVFLDRYQVGGPVPTALSLLARWGHSTYFFGKWGQDVYGQMIEADLRESEIGFEPNRPDDPVGSGFAHVWVERTTGRRSIACHRGALSLSVEALDMAVLESADALHLDGWAGPVASEAVRHVRAAGGLVFMDLGSPKPDWRELVSKVDHLNCPEVLVRRLFPDLSLCDAGKQLQAMGPASITVTQGELGAWFFDDRTALHQPAFRVDAVDTNGAGDVFNGALIHATLMGMEPLQRMRFASAASALKCRVIGNREAIPSMEAVELFLSAV